MNPVHPDRDADPWDGPAPADQRRRRRTALADALLFTLVNGALVACVYVLSLCTMF